MKNSICIRCLSLLVSVIMLVTIQAPAIQGVAVKTENREQSDDGFLMPDSSGVQQQYNSSDKFIASIDLPADDSRPVSNRAQLEAIRNNAGGTYHLTADIDLSASDWTPIEVFTGVFDAQGYVIRNMEINGDYTYAGLFGQIEGALVKNVGLENAKISINNSDVGNNIYTGGICGYALSSTISNCFNSGDILTSAKTYSNVGGISGLPERTFINNCYNTGNISAYAYGRSVNAGGICGAKSMKINNCYNTGNISAYAYDGAETEAYAGGICGRNPSNISNCYNTGSISSFSNSLGTYHVSNNYAGGICGKMDGGAIISNCYNMGAVSAESSVKMYSLAGGICGYGSHPNYGTSVNNCYNTGVVSSYTEHEFNSICAPGGICSPLSVALNNNCYWNTESEQIANGIPQTTKRSSGGTGKTSAEMQSPEFVALLNANAGEENSDWAFDAEAINGGYPVFAKHGISLSADDLFTFPATVKYYPAQTPYAVTISNKSDDRKTGALTVALTGADAYMFKLSAKSIDSINAGGSTTFTIAPLTGLLAETYTATVTVSAARDNGNTIAPKSFDVSYTVIDAHIISFDANGGIGAPKSQIKVDNEDFLLSTICPVREGYPFLGWSTYKMDTTATYQPGGQFNIAANTTLYAVWGEYCTVTYDANGGIGAPSSQQVVSGKEVALSSTIPVRDGYSFHGWSADSAATTASYRPGGAFTIDANITLYAVWLKCYVVTYDANGGIGAPESQEKVSGEILILSTTVPTLRGYSFRGWATSRSATTASYQPGASFAINENITLYAVWQEGYTITYYANESQATQIKIPNQDLYIISTIPVWQGHHFLGWATSNSAIIAQYRPGDKFTIDADTILYAVWADTTTCDDCHGSGSTLTTEKIKIACTHCGGLGVWSDYCSSCLGKGISHYQNISGVLTPIKCNRCLGIGRTSRSCVTCSGSGAIYMNSESYVSCLKCSGRGYNYIIPYLIQYDANGGTDAPADQIKYSGQNLTLSGSIPTRTGHIFLGWSRNSKATTATYSVGGIFSLNSDTRLYAVWKAADTDIFYAITVNGGTANKTFAAVGETVTVTADAAPAGKVFDLWISSDGMTFANAYKESANFVMPAKNITVTAAYKDEHAPIQDVEFIHDGTLYIVNYYIYFIDDMSVLDFVAKVREGNIRFFDKDGNEFSREALVRSGSKIVLNDSNGNEVDSYTIVKMGDVLGAGKIRIASARQALRIAVGIDEPEDEWQRLAADVNNDGLVKIADARSILRVAVNIDDASDWDSALYKQIN